VVGLDICKQDSTKEDYSSSYITNGFKYRERQLLNCFNSRPIIILSLRAILKILFNRHRSSAQRPQETLPRTSLVQQTGTHKLTCNSRTHCVHTHCKSHTHRNAHTHTLCMCMRRSIHTYTATIHTLCNSHTHTNTNTANTRHGHAQTHTHTKENYSNSYNTIHGFE